MEAGRSVPRGERFRKDSDMTHFRQATLAPAATGLLVLGVLAAAPATCLADQDPSIRPFSVHVPQAKLTDLRRRIAATQWPEKETVADQSQGVPLATMRELARYWATDHD